jgi:hypothetical protein
MEILETAIIFLFCLNVILLAAIIILWRRVGLFFKNRKTKNMEELMKNLMEETRQLIKKSQDFSRAIKNLEKLSKNNLIKTSLVRFNALGGLGGNQSFILVVLDLENNGFIISSFYTREGNRVYAKSINSGKPEFTLSEEEEEALQSAIKKF